MDWLYIVSYIHCSSGFRNAFHIRLHKRSSVLCSQKKSKNERFPLIRGARGANIWLTFSRTLSKQNTSSRLAPDPIRPLRSFHEPDLFKRCQKRPRPRGALIGHPFIPRRPTMHSLLVPFYSSICVHIQSESKSASCVSLWQGQLRAQLI